MFEAGNMPSSSATQIVVKLPPAVEFLPVDSATSYHGPRVAGPPADYSEEHHPPLKIHRWRRLVPTMTQSGKKRSEIPAPC